MIKDTRYVHLGLRFWEGETYVAFQDETNGPAEATTWRFYLFEGSETDALAHAERINLRPTVLVMGPQPEEPAPENGCGCRAADASSGAPLLLLLLLFAWRPRRRCSAPHPPQHIKTTTGFFRRRPRV